MHKDLDIDPRNIVCFGDSNTWGAVPVQKEGEGLRLPHKMRWTGQLQDHLGDSWRVINEGLPGRTTKYPDPVEGQHKSGLSYLQACLETHAPVHKLLIMLGTNDLKARFSLEAIDVAESAGQLVDLALSSGTLTAGRGSILLICPPPVLETGVLSWMFRGAAAKSKHLAEAFRAVSIDRGVDLFEASLVTASSPIDGIHIDATAHRNLAHALAGELDETK